LSIAQIGSSFPPVVKVFGPWKGAGGSIYQMNALPSLKISVWAVGATVKPIGAGVEQREEEIEITNGGYAKLEAHAEGGVALYNLDTWDENGNPAPTQLQHDPFSCRQVVMGGAFRTGMALARYAAPWRTYHILPNPQPERIVVYARCGGTVAKTGVRWTETQPRPVEAVWWEVYSQVLISADATGSAGTFELPPGFPDSMEYPGGLQPQPRKRGYVVIDRVHCSGFVSHTGATWWEGGPATPELPYSLAGDGSYQPVTKIRRMEPTHPTLKQKALDADFAAAVAEMLELFPGLS
jgi:hypothetical protein